MRTAPQRQAERAIPPVVSPLIVEEILIEESGDEIVDVVASGRIHLAPAYHAAGIASAPDEIKLRGRVLAGLHRAAAGLPAGVHLLLWDGLRRLETQRDVVEAFRASLPEAGREAVVERYLAPPPESEESFRTLPPPHSTGGAVDLTLCEESGQPWDLGAEFDQFDETSWLRHYEEPADSAKREAEISVYRARRRLLYWAMIDAGFSPYPWEFWHFELGTMVAQAHYGRPVAEYGPAVPWFDPEGQPAGR
ncbi:hypothetical protein OG943_16570 [Amycolatopsis sp. NBC_00345]|uniref:M15 family metallopeptidase n=1 Tax=Amycolatopsis sp. NBC_00345 TaxID=2975955 RepID=UPI002E25A6FB